MRLTWKRSPRVDRLVIAPGPVDAPVVGRLRRASRPSAWRPAPCTSCARARGTTSTASGVDTTTRSSTPTTAVSRSSEWTTQLRVSIGDDRAVQRVAGCVARRDVEDRVPAADVGPAEIAGDHGGAVGLFHHRVVDRLLRRAREALRHRAAGSRDRCWRSATAASTAVDHRPARSARARPAARRRGTGSCPNSTDSRRAT